VGLSVWQLMTDRFANNNLGASLFDSTNFYYPSLISHFSIMAEEKTVLEERSTSLRKELKAWEKQFADANGGRKAGRDDIKANLDIGISILDDKI